MPNDCCNFVTIYADEPTVKLLKDTGLKLCELVPKPEGETHEVWGTDRFYEYHLKRAGKLAIQFTICTAWSPANGLWLELMKKYKGILFLKNEWSVEDGPAGVWVGSCREGFDKITYTASGARKISIKHSSWDEGCIEEKYHRFRE